MRILVIGSGGREHAIVWKLKQSKKVNTIYCAPGNGGISDIATCVDIKATDINGIVEFAKSERIDLTVVAPDDPLAMGMVDSLQNAGIRAFGPTKNAAEIEASKVFAKDLMRKYNIPTAEYEVFNTPQDAERYLNTCKLPIVIKAEGLALGKGVIIAQSRKQALEAIHMIMIEKKFGKAGSRIVVEEFLQGKEVSILAFTDGQTIKPMVSSQDHKRAYDNDEGPNTGGMGAFSPSPEYTESVHRYVMASIIEPTVKAMNSEGRPFKGVLYFGLILTQDGPKILEYNARFGDPETQVVLPRLKTDLVDIMEAIINNKLNEIEIEWDERAAACIVMASGGYPKSYNKGHVINGIRSFDNEKDITVFSAGVSKENDNYYTNGGRVLGVTAIGSSLKEAVDLAYNGVNKIDFKDKHFRTDIGK